VDASLGIDADCCPQRQQLIKGGGDQVCVAASNAPIDLDMGEVPVRFPADPGGAVELLGDLALSLLVSHKSGVNLLDDIDLFLRAWH